MKLVRISAENRGRTRPSVVIGEKLWTGFTDSLTLSDLLEQYAENGVSGIRDDILHPRNNLETFDPASVSLEAPLVSSGRLFCMGGAYTSHLQERDRTLFTVPHNWLVPRTSVIGPNDPILIPDRVSEAVKPAIELGVVIGKSGSYIDEDEAREHIAGYTICNEVTARTDRPGPRGYKIMDTFSPVGPHIVTKDEVDNPLDLSLEIQLDGDTICHGSTSGHRFTLTFLVSYLSTIFKLRPGDIISTGDPGGVTGRLQPKSEVELEIEDIGTLSNSVKLRS